MHYWNVPTNSRIKATETGTDVRISRIGLMPVGISNPSGTWRMWCIMLDVLISAGVRSV